MIHIDINVFIPVELDQLVLYGGMDFYTWIYRIFCNFITDLLVPVTNEQLGIDLFCETNFQVSPSGYLALSLKEHVDQWNKNVSDKMRGERKKKEALCDKILFIVKQMFINIFYGHLGISI